MMYRVYRFLYGVVGFSRSQANGFLLFLPLVVAITFLPAAFRSYIKSRPFDHSADVAELKRIMAAWKSDSVSVSERTSPGIAFDPNTATAGQLVEAGLSPRLAERVIKFRSNGGRFRKNHDLLKIYGLDSGVYRRVEPYISIAIHPVASTLSARRGKEDAFKHSRQPKSDINTADTSRLKAVKGIGEKLSLRIVSYRESLGGFVSIHQVSEVYRLDSTAAQRIKNEFFVDPGFRPRKININTADRLQLAIHPYISGKAASAIVAYRIQHGNYQNTEDLRAIPAMDSVSLRKLVPYIKFTDEN